ncbi:MAG: hypothetical protein H0T65_11735 [Deltaproteobacteria bacterium]|nr:hypothetical protein [Deltaproteobacteria bacterium]
MVLKILAVAAAVWLVYVFARGWRAASARRRSEPMGPHAKFDGGDRYVTADERLRVETDGPGGAGEGVLMALVDALRARGVGTNPVEPESYGFMTVVEVDGGDIILTLAAGGDQDWILFVKAPNGKVPMEIMDAVRSLEDVRNVTWAV